MERSAGGMTATRGLAKIRVRARSTLLRNDPDTAAIFQERKFTCFHIVLSLRALEFFVVAFIDKIISDHSLNKKGFNM